MPTEVLRQREVKWLDMLSHWDKWMNKRFNKVSMFGSVAVLAYLFIAEVLFCPD